MIKTRVVETATEPERLSGGWLREDLHTKGILLVEHVLLVVVVTVLTVSIRLFIIVLITVAVVLGVRLEEVLMLLEGVLGKLLLRLFSV